LIRSWSSSWATICGRGGLFTAQQSGEYFSPLLGSLRIAR
jgi:hypothetical protein